MVKDHVTRIAASKHLASPALPCLSRLLRMETHRWSHLRRVNMPLFVLSTPKHARPDVSFYSIGPVESVISEDSSLGACWAMSGSEGLVTVQLPREITVDAVSVEHSSRMVTAESASAPKDFKVRVFRRLFCWAARMLRSARLFLSVVLGNYQTVCSGCPVLAFFFCRFSAVRRLYVRAPQSMLDRPLLPEVPPALVRSCAHAMDGPCMIQYVFFLCSCQE